MSLDFWRTVTLGSAAVGQTLFLLLYLTFPWWRSFLGRALFYKGLTLTAILDLFVLSRVWHFSAVDTLFVVFYGALAVGIWWQTIAFLVVKAKGRSRLMRGDA